MGVGVCMMCMGVSVCVYDVHVCVCLCVMGDGLSVTEGAGLISRSGYWVRVRDKRAGRYY